MVQFREASVTDPSPQTLLADYFASRAATFPPSMGEYRVAMPTPSDFVAPTGLFLVVEDEVDGRLTDVGCGGIRLVKRSSGAPQYEIKHLWIDPAARGGGRGRMLLAELEERARLLGASEVVLDTNVAQEAASTLYRNSGYVEIPPYNDNPNATHWFGKTLTVDAE